MNAVYFILTILNNINLNIISIYNNKILLITRNVILDDLNSENVIILKNRLNNLCQ